APSAHGTAAGCPPFRYRVLPFHTAVLDDSNRAGPSDGLVGGQRIPALPGLDSAQGGHSLNGPAPPRRGPRPVRSRWRIGGLMVSIGRLAWARFVTLAKPFFRSELRWWAIGMLALIIGLQLGVK